MINIFDSEVYACDSDGYAEYFSSISKKNEIKKDKKVKNVLSKNEIKKINLSK